MTAKHPMICLLYTSRGIVTGKDKDDYIETARRKAHDLKEYIDILFDWFKLNSNEFAMDINTVEAAELTRNILIDWIPIFEDRQIAVSYTHLDYNYTDMICRKDLGVMEYMSCPEAAKK